MQNIVGHISELLGGEGLATLSGSVGADETSTGKGVTAAVPLVLSALQTKAQSPSGTASLLETLNHFDADGVLGDLHGTLSNPTVSGGVPLLSEVFGGEQAEVEKKVARASGLTEGIVGRLLPLIVPVVVGYIARQIRGEGGTAADATVLTKYLGEQQGYLKASAPGLTGFIERIDANDDGSVLDDVARVARGLFGKKPA